MSIPTLTRFLSLVVYCALVCACSSHSSGNKGGGVAGQPPTVEDVVAGAAGAGPVMPFQTEVQVATACRTACEPGECGPVSDGCGKLLDCGGCVDPLVCGGAGIPSHCGSPLASCIPRTCAMSGATCGLQSDGCGGILDCWSAAAKAMGPTPACEVPGTLCVEGACISTAPVCTKLTCASYAGAVDLCGPVTDGCGGVLDCGLACSSDKVCGVREPGKCAKIECVPMTCEAALATKPAGYCGVVPDGCGGILKDCGGGCAIAGESCGGGGVADVCGKGAPVCVAKTSAACGSTCGPISDGCGGTIQCATCAAPATCGGGGIPSQCGTFSCRPRTCESAGASCGMIADGCGGQIDCSSCMAPNTTCGGGGIPNRCGSPGCVPKLQAEVCVPGKCGPQSDGCGGVVECGGCTSPNTCGGGGIPSVCGTPVCKKRTCADAGANCGPIGDGCGGVIPSCGICTGSDVCGAVYPSVCGAGVNPNCTGLCQKVDRTCASGTETRLTGKVTVPNGTLPLSNAVVYVPNATLPTITSGPSCDRCQDEELGKPITSTLSAADGSFVLRNVPAGVSFQLVTKLGKWRRAVTIPAITACTNLNLTAEQARLPKNMADADAANLTSVNIPRIAVITGGCDAMECILRSIGVADTEFTAPTGNGRIHVYNGGGGYIGTSSSSTLADIFKTSASRKEKIYDYDMAIMDCNCSPQPVPAYDPILHAWANAGGRFFTSHYGYAYLEKNGDFANTAAWNSSSSGSSGSTGIIDKVNARGKALNDWMGAVGAWSPTYGDGYVELSYANRYVGAVNDGADRLLYTGNFTYKGTTVSAATSTQQFAFNTPFRADADHICGRVLYSAFHVTSDGGSSEFPGYCSSAALTSQEKTLVFGLFDLSACVSGTGTPPPPTCTPKTCTEMSANCGQVADGCGGLLDCGTCVAPQTCGGGGVPNQCGISCTRTTCGAEGANCGVIADGCGGTLACGTCNPPDVCGGGGTPNVCGKPVCAPITCAAAGANCGAMSDGCGATIDCGACLPPMTCGGAGTPNVCGIGTCLPGNCGSAVCGYVGDGCGGEIPCGTCPDGYGCIAGACVAGACSPRSCANVSATCGYIGDGCGGVVSCGTCTPPQICGGAGIPSQCGGNCAPRSCQAAKASCGAISDGCGGVKECGVCPPGQSCGGGGIPNQCAAGTCVPRICAALDANCGLVGDGCGAVLDCGKCVAPETCGGSGVPNKCGTGGCVPLTCAQQQANCGPVADGCGGLLDCGPCPKGQTCGGGGIPSQCGGSIIM